MNLPLNRLPPMPLLRRRNRRRRILTEVGSVMLGVVLLIWSLLPVYNMLLVALDEDGDEFTGAIWPGNPWRSGWRKRGVPPITMVSSSQRRSTSSSRFAAGSAPPTKKRSFTAT